MSEPRIILPEDIKDFVEVENCNDFDRSKYFITEVQIDVLKAICDDIDVGNVMRDELNLNYANTTLLYGPSGTGKTTFGRFVASHLDKDFAYLNFAKVIDGMFGNTARNISRIIRYMTEQDCVFMLDEIDCIATKRGEESAASGGELSRITITLMQELDYCKRHNPKAIILAATNVIDNLDPALRTRFSIEREIPLLTNREKEGFIYKYLNALEIPYDKENIREYVARSSRVTQRKMESDMLRAIADWIKKGREEMIYLERIYDS